MQGSRSIGADENRFTAIQAVSIVACIGMIGLFASTVLGGGVAHRTVAAVAPSGATGTSKLIATAQVASLPTSVAGTVDVPTVSSSAPASSPNAVGSHGTATAALPSSDPSPSPSAAVNAPRVSAAPAPGHRAVSGSTSVRHTASTAQAQGHTFSTLRTAADTPAPTVIPPQSARFAADASQAGSTGSTGSSSTSPGQVPSDPTAFYGGLGETQAPGSGYWILPGEDLNQVTGGSPSMGKFSGVWTPNETGTGQWIIAPGATAPSDADPTKTIDLKPGEGAENVNGTYVVYQGTGGVPGTLGYAP